jgi:hypothetical protein
MIWATRIMCGVAQLAAELPSALNASVHASNVSVPGLFAARPPITWQMFSRSSHVVQLSGFWSCVVDDGLGYATHSVSLELVAHSSLPARPWRRLPVRSTWWVR